MGLRLSKAEMLKPLEFIWIHQNLKKNVNSTKAQNGANGYIELTLKRRMAAHCAAILLLVLCSEQNLDCYV